jgi:transcriptional regulator GlxA family with amidase domain
MAHPVRLHSFPPSNHGTSRVLVLLLPEVHLQDLAGPVQVLSEAAQLGGAYQLSFCGVERRVRSAQGLELGDLEALPSVTAEDLVLVPGISSATLGHLEHAPVEWLRAAHVTGARIASVCSGAFVLARAGLLDGRQCTTHWKLVDRLRREAPRAHVLDNRLFVEDRGVVSSAGVAAGIDMALGLVEKDFGPVVASRVAREMVVYLRRRGDQEQLSVYLDHRTHLHPGVHQVQDFLVQHPDKKPKLSELAHLAAMSPRNLTRVFSRATGITPKQFASKVKLQVARDLVDDPQRSVEAIASSCGFDDARQLRRLWKETFGVSIADFRARRSRIEEGRSP